MARCTEEVGVTPDRRREVRVRRIGQPEVADVVRAVGGLCHGAQQDGLDEVSIGALPWLASSQLAVVLAVGSSRHRAQASSARIRAGLEPWPRRQLVERTALSSGRACRYCARPRRWRRACTPRSDGARRCGRTGTMRSTLRSALKTMRCLRGVEVDGAARRAAPSAAFGRAGRVVQAAAAASRTSAQKRPGSAVESMAATLV